MATRSATRTDRNDGITSIIWEGITESDSGAAVIAADLFSKTVQAIGDFDASGAITMQGSNDGTNWFTLTDPTGADVVLTAATMGVIIMENPLYVRPTATAGTSVDMDVYLVGQRS